MNVKQVADLVNQIQGEILGKEAVSNEDLSNVVEVGKALANANGVDNFVKTLTDRIGKTVFVDRVYSGFAPSIMMEGWEFGSILQKIMCELPDATTNETWNLTDGASYDVNVFHAPTISVRYFNKKITFQIEMSLTDRQIKEAFKSANDMMKFTALIYNTINNAMTLKVSGLAQSAIANMIGLTLYKDYNSTTTFTGASHTRAVNLLYEYNNGPNSGGSALAAADALTNKEFLRFAAMRMGQYVDRLRIMSTLFNIEEKARFTSTDRLKFILHSDFFNAAKAYLYSDTFNDEFVRLPGADIVPYWQGSGTGYAFSDTGKINIKTTDNNDMTITGILGVMFDRDAVAVANVDRRTTAQRNEAAEFTNTWTKWDCELLNDPDENFVVFFVA